MNIVKALRSKKGFTLVEVIVVLIILAILAAILIPSLTGYIDKANQKVVIAEARSAVMAAQTLGSEKYANGTTYSATVAADMVSDIEELAEVKGDVSALTYTASWKVDTLTYSNGSWKVTYTEAGGFGTPTEVS